MNVIFEQSNYIVDKVIHNAYIEKYHIPNLDIIPANINLALSIERVRFRKSEAIIRCLINRITKTI